MEAFVCGVIIIIIFILLYTVQSCFKNKKIRYSIIGYPINVLELNQNNNVEQFINKKTRNIMSEGLADSRLTESVMQKYKDSISSVKKLDETVEKFTILDLKEIANTVDVSYLPYFGSVSETLELIDTFLPEPYIPLSDKAKQLLSYNTYDAYLEAFVLSCMKQREFGKYTDKINDIILNAEQPNVNLMDYYNMAVSMVYKNTGMSLRPTAYPSALNIKYGNIYFNIMSIVDEVDRDFILPNIPTEPNFTMLGSYDVHVKQMFKDKFVNNIKNDIYNTGNKELQNNYAEGSELKYLRNFSDISDDYLRFSYADNKISSELTYTIRSEYDGTYFDGSSTMSDNNPIRWQLLERNGFMWITYTNDSKPVYKPNTFIQPIMVYKFNYNDRTTETVTYDMYDYRIKSDLFPVVNVPKNVIPKLNRKIEGIDLGAIKSIGELYDVPTISLLYKNYIVAVGTSGYSTDTNMKDFTKIANNSMITVTQLPSYIFNYGSNYYNRIEDKLYSNVYLMYVTKNNIKYQVVRNNMNAVVLRAQDSMSEMWFNTKYTAAVKSHAIYESSSVMPDYTSPMYYSMNDNFVSPILYQLPSIKELYPFVILNILQIHPVLGPYGKVLKTMIYTDALKLCSIEFLRDRTFSRSIDSLPKLSIDYLVLDAIRSTPIYESISRSLSPIETLVRWFTLMSDITMIEDIYSVTYGALWIFDQRAEI